jgi:hypothetical protein
MGEILGLGITHYPSLSFKRDHASRTRQLLSDPALPEKFRSPDDWPAAMRREWADDEGRAHQARHRAALIAEFHKSRKELDDFNPDFLVIWGDDQYENFKEDCVPPFALLAFDELEAHPWQSKRMVGTNSWDEPADTAFTIRGHRAGGKYLASSLLREGFDIAYGYKPLHGEPLGHAFVNSVLYLDWERRGFGYPIVPISVNSYGRSLISQRGRAVSPSEAAALDGEEDPPAPQPWRCFQLGAAVARAAAQSPWRVALVASSSWSHSFLTAKHGLFFPDVEADRDLYAALSEGDWEPWRRTTIEEAEDHGHHELLNWYCLAGAMAELGRKPDYSVFLESWITNSDKVFATFRP